MTSKFLFQLAQTVLISCHNWEVLGLAESSIRILISHAGQSSIFIIRTNLFFELKECQSITAEVVVTMRTFEWDRILPPATARTNCWETNLFESVNKELDIHYPIP